MIQLNPYLNFNGNCRQALVFYQQCLGGELSFQTVGDSPMAAGMPVEMRDKILHSTLSTSDLLIMGSDMMSPTELNRGNNISLNLNFEDEESIRKTFAKLGCNGEITHPLAEMFWGDLFGILTDQFGINWLFNYEKNKQAFRQLR